jgi:phage/plasmid-associated DNA primase
LKRNIFKNINYDDWFKIALAIKNEIPNSFYLFNMISMQNKKKYDGYRECELFFNKLNKKPGEKKIKWGTLVNIIKSKLGEDEYKQFLKEYRSILKNRMNNDNDEEEDDNIAARTILSGMFTDADIASYMFDLYGKDFVVYCDFIYFWNGKYWVKKTSHDDIHKTITVNLFKHLKEVADKLYNKDDKLEQYQKVLKKLIKLRNNASKKGIIEEFIILVRVDEDKFDMNPDLLGFQNGVYDLKNDIFRDAKRDDYISLLIPYDYKKSSDEEMKEFMKFIDKVLPVEDEKNFLLKALSSGLAGRTLENILILTGSGRNGKDTLISYLLQQTLGDALFYNNSNSVITGNNTSGVNQEKSNMNKKRVVMFNEPNKDSNLKCCTLKEISGGREINARGLYSSNTKTILHCTNIILCNKIPVLDNVDEAISQRLYVIPFRSLFRKPEDIAKMPEGTEYVYEVNTYYKDIEFINNSRVAFMNLLLNYYRLFKQDGYVLKGAPQSIVDMSKAYMSDCDNFFNWFNEVYDKTDNNHDVVKMCDLYDIFRSSDLYLNLSKKEKRSMNKKKLTEEVSNDPNLKTHFRDRIKIKGNNYYSVLIGYKLKDEFYY